MAVEYWCENTILHLDDFTEGFCKTLLNVHIWEDDGIYTGRYGIDDFSPEAMEQIVRECKEFQYTYDEYFNEHWSQAGSDFLLTRNRHGAGFWDSPDEPYGAENKDILTIGAHSYSECDVYVANDKLYII